MQKKEMQPSLRLCDVARPSDGPCGFHLTRTAWDPYPWVSGVESGSPAETAGLQAGDCVLEVNGEDVLGQRIEEVASRVRARADRVTLMLWNAGSDPYTAATCVSMGQMILLRVGFMGNGQWVAHGKKRDNRRTGYRPSTLGLGT
jgi:Periplasmic protease